jgi:hypothetical protein
VRSNVANEGLTAGSNLMSGTSDVFNRLMQNQLGALGMGPQTLGLSTLPGTLLSQVGTQQQAQNQAELSDDVSRWFANYNAPLDNLGAFQQLISGNYGTSTTQQTPYWEGNNLMSGLGGAALGMGLNSLGSVGTGWGMLGAMSPWVLPLAGFASAFI